MDIGNAEQDVEAAARFGPVVTRRWLLEQGYTDQDVVRLRHSGYEVLARGIYGRSADIGGHPVRAHRLLAGELVARAPAGTALARVSAAVAHGLPVWGMELARVHLARNAPGRGSRSSMVARMHRSTTAATVIRDGIAVQPIAVVLADLARTEDERASVACLDAAFHRGLCSGPQVRAELADQPRCGRPKALRVLARTDPLSRDLADSLSRFEFAGAGLPAATRYAELPGRDGDWLGAPPFYWPDAAVVGLCGASADEFDQARLLDAGYLSVRWTEDDIIDRPEWVVDQLRRALLHQRPQLQAVG